MIIINHARCLNSSVARISRCGREDPGSILGCGNS